MPWCDNRTHWQASGYRRDHLRNRQPRNTFAGNTGAGTVQQRKNGLGNPESHELGVAEIQPLDTERSVARLSADRATKRLEHWRQVAISACEQCGRNLLPEIHAPLDIMAWLQQIKAMPETKLILLPQGAASLHSMEKPDGSVTLLIGAEGGFTEAESSSALHCGFAPIRLGARVLRTETAAVAGLAALQTLWGDFNL